MMLRPGLVPLGPGLRVARAPEDDELAKLRKPVPQPSGVAVGHTDHRRGHREEFVGLEVDERCGLGLALAIRWTAADLVVSEPALASLHQLPFVELLLTLLFLAVVVAARFRHLAFARVGARTRPADERERRAS
jgi:hypothetical protein